MTDKIDADVQRFRQIVRGKVRENLRRYVSHGEMIGRQGKDLVSIPVPQLDLPRFRYGQNGSGGVGSGDGEPGQPLQPGENGPGKAGASPAPHVMEVEVSLDELAEMLGDELELPRIEPKGQAKLQETSHRYNAIRRAGPESLRHFRRTYVQALRRQIAAGTYDARRPRVMPIREDRRYRAWNAVEEPRACAVIIYLMDVSGSMTDDQKELVRTAAFWIDTWLKRQYDGVERRYIIHDAVAKIVDEHTFYHTRESGGTRISSAYSVARQLLDEEFPANDWNIYFFQFSDGDNWSEDNKHCLRILDQQLMPACRLFCYGQVESPYGSGDFLHALEKRFNGAHDGRLILAEIASKDEIYDALKLFLGTGR